jgi:hypothetical protein
MKTRPSLFVLITLATCFAATSAFAMSDKEVERAYYGCLKFLKLSPERQKAVAERSGYSLQQTEWACHLMAKQGLRRCIELEHEYQRGESGEPSYPAPSTPSPPPRSSDLTSGTCYDMMGCSGSSVHVDNKFQCPASYDSFQADIGGYGCESLH